MSAPFKIFLGLLLCGAIFFVGYQLYDRHQKDLAAQEAAIQFNDLQAWASSVLKHSFDVSNLLQGCGSIRFDSPDLAGIKPHPFTMVFEIEPSVVDCLQQKERMQALAEAIAVLHSDGLTDLAFVDNKTKNPLISFSAASGWKNHTQTPLEFPKA